MLEFFLFLLISVITLESSTHAEKVEERCLKLEFSSFLFFFLLMLLFYQPQICSQGKWFSKKENYLFSVSCTYSFIPLKTHSVCLWAQGNVVSQVHFTSSLHHLPDGDSHEFLMEIPRSQPNQTVTLNNNHHLPWVAIVSVCFIMILRTIENTKDTVHCNEKSKCICTKRGCYNYVFSHKIKKGGENTT